MKTSVTWFCIAVAGVLSFYIGRRTSPSQTEVVAVAESGSVSVDSKNAGPSLRSVNKLFEDRPTRLRDLEIRGGILSLDAKQLGQLWDRQQATFDYNNGNDRRIIDAILKRLAELDPQAALAKVADTGAVKYEILPAVLAGWVSADPDAAIEWCRTQTDPRARRAGLSSVIEEIGQTDREAAVSLYLGSVDEKVINSNGWHGFTFFSRWAKEDPSAALKAALRIQEATGKNRAFRGAIDVWGRFDGPAAANWIAANTSGDLKETAHIVMIAGWAEVDPRAAGEFALSLVDAEYFNEATLHVLDGWTHNDFAAAAGWVDGIEDPKIKAELQQTLVERSKDYADREPALDYALANLGSNPSMLEALMPLTKELASRDPQAALDWGAEHLKDPEQLNRFRTEILDHLSWSNPADAADLIAALPPSHEKTEALHAKTAERWARNDPAAARSWLESLAPGEIQEAAVLGYAEGWMSDRSEHAAAAEWIGALPAGEVRDQLTDRQARAHMNFKDIDRSIEIAQSIEDPFVRDKTFEGILKTWYRDEIKAEAARAFIESTDLVSDTVKWRVLNRKDGHP